MEEVRIKGGKQQNRPKCGKRCFYFLCTLFAGKGEESIPLSLPPRFNKSSVFFAGKHVVIAIDIEVMIDVAPSVIRVYLFFSFSPPRLASWLRT